MENTIPEKQDKELGISASESTKLEDAESKSGEKTVGSNQENPKSPNDRLRPQKTEKKPWIRYRVEYRHPFTDDLIFRTDSEKLETSLDEHHGEALNEPVFEVVTTFKTRIGVGSRRVRNPPSTPPSPISPAMPPRIPGGGPGMAMNPSIPRLPPLPPPLPPMLPPPRPYVPPPRTDIPFAQKPPPVAYSAPTFGVRIFSLSIINALQSVVQYYPNVDLTGDTLEIDWPYPVLVHHYDELKEFSEDCKSKDPSELCEREVNAHAHLQLLLDFLDEHIMDEVWAEKERMKSGKRTFEWCWVGLKPGSTMLDRTLEDTEWQSYVIMGVRGGVFNQGQPSSWIIQRWSLQFDGKYVGRVRMGDLIIHPFDGEGNEAEDRRRIECGDDYDDEIVKKYRDYGENYWNLLQKSCKFYKGKSNTFPYNERKVSGEKTVHARFEDYNTLTLEYFESLSDHEYLLCPITIPAFYFKTRTWEMLHVKDFSEPEFNENMINNLVMDDARVNTLKSLAKAYARTNKRGEEMKKAPWTADFVKGKGHGLIFLLHGKPGVGKTCTAECIAEFTRRPLMILTCSDIGTNPRDIESNLTLNFKTAKSWGAVLLIDEADVFMERRSTADFHRNSLVAGFLRALEFYDGILFLTTNRVGSFDDAFISRVHVQIYYPDFTDSQRQAVWKTFIDKLNKDRGDYMRLNIDAKEYLRGSEMRALKWNGREIRNAFQTAVSLSEYDGELDAEGKIVMTDKHLRAVVELSRDFKEYLNDLHKGDEAKRAERKYERLDSYNKP